MSTNVPTRPSRGGRSARDIAMSLVVLLVPVFLLIGLYRLLGHETPTSVDAGPAYESAEHAFPVARLGTLPPGWRVVVAQYRDGVLRLGVTARSGSALQVVESAGQPSAVVPAELGAGAHLDGLVHVNGADWQRYTGFRAGEVALVSSTDKRTVLVLGRAADDELALVIRSLG